MLAARTLSRSSPFLFVYESGRPAVQWLTREPFAGVATAAGCCYGEELGEERGGGGLQQLLTHALCLVWVGSVNHLGGGE